MAPAVLSSRCLCSIALLPDWTGQMPLRMTFVDDLMHFHSWHRVWGYDREASKWKKISNCKFIRKGSHCVTNAHLGLLLSALNIKPNADDRPFENMLAGRSEG